MTAERAIQVGPRFFHRTSAECARAILEGGFRDGVGSYMTKRDHAGVWISAGGPLSGNEGAGGGVVLVVEGLTEEEFSTYEWVEEIKGYREALVPADMLNTRARVVEVWIADDHARSREDADEVLSPAEARDRLGRDATRPPPRSLADLRRREDS